MEPEQQAYLAELVRGHREHLEQVLAQMVERAEPVSALEAQLLVDAATIRLEIVENTLRFSGSTPTRPIARLGRIVGRRHLRLPRPGFPRSRLVLARIRSWTKPRIGRLRHYPAKPLLLPLSYLSTSAPSPAPLISLVTPAYEHGKFLGRTIQSVLDQGYPELEYVVQDGGSTDETLDLLRHFDGQLSSWASEPDEGQADAINRAFAKTSGEIMGWLNSDDLLLPGALACVAGYFVSHPDVDVVYGNRVMIDENDDQIGAWILPGHDDRALTLADYIPQETLFWRRQIWDASGGHVDTRFGYALDWDLLLRFRDAGATMVRLPRFLGAFRVHEAQKTSAAEELGHVEMALLRERVHGRAISTDEILRELRPYLFRHIVVHSWERAVDRLPLRRVRIPEPSVPFSPQRELEESAVAHANSKALNAEMPTRRIRVSQTTELRTDAGGSDKTGPRRGG